VNVADVAAAHGVGARPRLESSAEVGPVVDVPDGLGDEMASPDGARAVDGEARVACFTSLAAARVVAPVEVEVGVHAADALDLGRLVIIGHALERVHPDVDRWRERGTQRVDVVEVLTQPDHAHAEPNAQAGQRAALGHERRPLRLPRVEGQPEGDALAIGRREPSRVAAQVGLDRDAVHVRHVAEPEHGFLVVAANQRFTPRGEEHADAPVLPLYPCHEALEFDRVRAQLLPCVAGLREGAVVATVIAAAQRASVENVPGHERALVSI